VKLFAEDRGRASNVRVDCPLRYLKTPCNVGGGHLISQTERGHFPTLCGHGVERTLDRTRDLIGSNTRTTWLREGGLVARDSARKVRGHCTILRWTRSDPNRRLLGYHAIFVSYCINPSQPSLHQPRAGKKSVARRPLG
jgi:hypothetical protein